MVSNLLEDRDECTNSNIKDVGHKDRYEEDGDVEPHVKESAIGSDHSNPGNGNSTSLRMQTVVKL